jgi:hypothetical protein
MDPFPAKEQDGETAMHTFHYLDRQTTEVRGEPELIDEYYERFFGTRNQSVKWWMFTLGPDLDHDEDLTGTEPEFAATLYDPTNGTLSNGDIFMFQGRGLGD